jgi:hypothetical protein
VPRQIIDTESSRPQYIRRIVVTTSLIVIVVAVLLIAAFIAWERFGGAKGNTPSPRVSWQPSITSPKENPCCVA